MKVFSKMTMNQRTKFREDVDGILLNNPRKESLQVLEWGAIVCKGIGWGALNMELRCVGVSFTEMRETARNCNAGGLTVARLCDVCILQRFLYCRDWESHCRHTKTQSKTRPTNAQNPPSTRVFHKHALQTAFCGEGLSSRAPCFETSFGYKRNKEGESGGDFFFSSLFSLLIQINEISISPLLYSLQLLLFQTMD